MSLCIQHVTAMEHNVTLIIGNPKFTTLFQQPIQPVFKSSRIVDPPSYNCAGAVHDIGVHLLGRLTYKYCVLYFERSMDIPSLSVFLRLLHYWYGGDRRYSVRPRWPQGPRRPHMRLKLNQPLIVQIRATMKRVEVRSRDRE